MKRITRKAINKALRGLNLNGDDKRSVRFTATVRNGLGDSCEVTVDVPEEKIGLSYRFKIVAVSKARAILPKTGMGTWEVSNWRMQ